MSYRGALGDWGEEVAAKLLECAGFKEIVLLNRRCRNYPGGDLLATLDGRRFLFSVKTRDRFMQNGDINSGYNIYPDKVIAAAGLHAAEPGWVVVRADRRNNTYCVFWGKISELSPSARKDHRGYVSMVDSATISYRCLGQDITDTRIADLFAEKGY